MTLQECKDQVAKDVYGHADWKTFIADGLDWRVYRDAADEVAELYAQSKIGNRNININNSGTLSPLQIAIYAVNCDNSDERADEVARCIELYARSKWDEACEAQKEICTNLLNDWEFGGRSQAKHFEFAPKPELSKTEAMKSQKEETPEKPDFEKMAEEVWEDANSKGHRAIGTVLIARGMERIWRDFVASKEVEKDQNQPDSKG